MCCGSATDASIAASQAAAAGQSQAASDALNFARDVFNLEKQQRAPFVNAGTSAVTGAMQLLGLGPNGIILPGGSRSGASGGVVSAGRGVGGTGTGGSGLKNLGSYVPPGSNLYSYVPPGNNMVDFARANGANTFNDHPPNLSDFVPSIPAQDGTETTPDPQTPAPFTSSMLAQNASPTLQTGSGATSGATAVLVTDSYGNSQWKPASLAPFYAARGFTVGQG